MAEVGTPGDVTPRGAVLPKMGEGVLPCLLQEPQLPATNHSPLVQKHWPTPQADRIPVVNPKVGMSLLESSALWEPLSIPAAPPRMQGSLQGEESPGTLP